MAWYGRQPIERKRALVQFIQANSPGEDLITNWRDLAIKAIEAGFYAPTSRICTVAYSLRTAWIWCHKPKPPACGTLDECLEWWHWRARMAVYEAKADLDRLRKEAELGALYHFAPETQTALQRVLEKHGQSGVFFQG